MSKKGEDLSNNKDTLENNKGFASEKQLKNGKAKDLADTIKLSRQEYEELQETAKKSKENWDKFLRVYAELENSRRLWQRQKQEYIKFGNFRLLKECISILDEFEQAAENIEKVDPHLADGIKMTCKKFRAMLEKENVKEIETEGCIFDPHLHEAVAVEERDDLPEGSIIEVVQKGYKYEDKILRPVKVKISKKTGG